MNSENRSVPVSPSTVASEAEADSLQRAVDAAHREISALCHGKQWRMCIPVDPSDSDIVICDALRALKSRVAALEAENARLRHELAALTAEREAGRRLVDDLVDRTLTGLREPLTLRDARALRDEFVLIAKNRAIEHREHRSAAPPTPTRETDR